MKTSRLRTASAIFVTLATTAAAAPAFSGTAVAATPVAAARQQVDFNGDGYQDMYASVPDGTVSGLKKAGYLVVYPGDAKGISAARHRVINQNTSGVPGTAAANARFGAGTPADIDRDRVHRPAGLGRQRPAGHPVRRQERPRRPGRRVPGPGVRGGRLRR
ncbi:hypothetical protein RB201_13420 [Streptomyces sp. S1A(2023)]